MKRLQELPDVPSGFEPRRSLIILQVSIPTGFQVLVEGAMGMEVEEMGLEAGPSSLNPQRG